MREVATAPMPVWLLVTCLFCGCATHSQQASERLVRFQRGEDTQVFAEMQRDFVADGKDRLVHALDLGALKLCVGDLAKSREYFGAVLDDMVEREEGAVVRLRDVGASGFSLALGYDASVPYRPAGYELVMALHYLALGYLFDGNLQSATVEFNRAVYLQDEVRAKSEAAIQKAQDEADAKAREGVSQMQSHITEMAAISGRVRSAYENPYTWYLAGLLYEIQGERSSSYQAYRKAWELSPQNPYLRQDVLRMATTESSHDYADLRKQHGDARPLDVSREGELVVFYEEGLISRKQSVEIPIILPGIPATKIVFPVYRDPPYTATRLGVYLNTAHLGDLAPVCYLQSLAYRDLQDKLPGIAARMIARAIVKGASKKALTDSDNAAVKMLGLAWQAADLVAERADTRAWYALPMIVQTGRWSLPVGLHVVELRDALGTFLLSRELQVLPGQRNVVWARDFGQRGAVVHVGIRGDDVTTTPFGAFGDFAVVSNRVEHADAELASATSPLPLDASMPDPTNSAPQSASSP